MELLGGSDLNQGGPDLELEIFVYFKSTMCIHTHTVIQTCYLTTSKTDLKMQKKALKS